MKKLSFVLGIFLIPILTFSQIIDVPADYPTIQQGILAAQNGDTVLVDTGMYVENINFNGKNITVASHYLTTFNTAFISQTIIDGGQPKVSDSGSVVMFNSGEDSTALLCGFTISNGSGLRTGSGYNSQTHGGGILITNNSSPVLKNLIVTGNIAQSCNGAGICCWDNSNPIIENVKVIDNDGTGNSYTNDGSGGISVSRSSPIIKNVEIRNNIGLLAGGIFCNEGSNPLLINVTISNNMAFRSLANIDSAEMICWQGSHPILINTVIWNDNLKEIIVRDNEITIGYSNIQGGAVGIENYGIIHWLEGNIDQDPLFLGSGDHPCQIKDNSPCIDAGTPSVAGLNLPLWDLKGNLRLWDGKEDGDTIIDMGAYEYGAPIWFSIDEEYLPSYIQHEELYIYPNPAKNTLNLSLEGYIIEEASIYTLTGQQVLQVRPVNSIIDISTLPRGMYIVEARVENRKVRRKLVIE